ncbi:hypothetical protein [Immundisolibacter sp.]|uniref:hypothetical protein n=1 Tax=Immundisolibacter sp. TaxID=1934948 RepID=UPI0035690726
MQQLAVPFTLCTLWFMVAWAIEKFWLTVFCAQCSSLFAFELSLQGHDLLTVSTGRVSAVLLFVVPFLAYALALIPYRRPGSGEAWSTAIQKWSRPFFWLALVAFWAWMLESAYSMFSGILPEGFKAYAQGYRLHLSGTALGLREITINGGLGGLLGLIFGLYLFLSRGLAHRE